jgi:hypothetical protein
MVLSIVAPYSPRNAAWYSANLMLDEPPLIVRMQVFFEFMADSFIKDFPCL